MLDINVSQIVYNYVFVVGGVGLVVWGIFKFGVHRAIDTHMAEIMAELTPMVDKIKRIEYQVYNNGGESMKDSIDRIERDVIDLKINQAVIKTKLDV